MPVWPRVVADRHPSSDIAGDFRMLDPEVAAIQQVLSALMALHSYSSRVRVLEYARERVNEVRNMECDDADEPA